MKMRALQAFTYNQQDLKAGDVFNTKTKLHAQILEQNRRAEYAKAEVKTTSLQAEDKSEDTTETPRRGRSRKAGNKVGATGSGLVHRYRRTDLEAEDS